MRSTRSKITPPRAALRNLSVRGRLARVDTAARALVVASVLVVSGGCATHAFAPSPVDSSAFIQRGISQSEGSIVVTAAVPSAAEVESLVGLDLYADGIQPIWLRVENNGGSGVRVALKSIDKEYFAPLEVAWGYRKRFNKEGRAELNRWFHDNQMPRHIAAGDTRSGLVFTHLTEGTKGFNVDVYASMDSAQFTFFVPLPGFRPDYMDVKFRNLYGEDEVVVTDLDGLRDILGKSPCCTTDQAGEALGDPLNIVIVGTPTAVRRSLLRGNWQETEADSPATRLARTHYYRERKPDGTFHKARPDGSERKELRLWLAPILVGGVTVWLGHVSYDMSVTLFARDLSDYRIDPDVDDARMYLLQNFWYGQSLRALAMALGVPPAPIDAPHTNFHGAEYFTDGLRAVLIVSEDPVAMDETDIIAWEKLVAE